MRIRICPVRGGKWEVRTRRWWGGWRGLLGELVICGAADPGQFIPDRFDTAEDALRAAKEYKRERQDSARAEAAHLSHPYIELVI